ncbi:MAG TPA: hypothetical protein VMH34_02245 [Gammaproteobacteria bacterium]|nr:hypothetical protein [Gammaproteobacteria bacterium]
MNDLDVRRAPLPRDLPRWSWLFVPLVFPIFQQLFAFFDAKHYLIWMEGEEGFVEQASWIFAFAAAAVGTSLLRQRRRLPSRWLAVWLLFGTLACVYVGGEEVDWGQDWFHWKTPEEWAKINKQHETNLHNTSSWFNQKPELVLQVGIFVGGLVYPLTVGRRRRRQGIESVNDWRFWLWPTAIVVPTAIISLAITLLNINHRIYYFGPTFNMTRWSETAELYYYYFMLLYMLSFRHRLKQC